MRTFRQLLPFALLAWALFWLLVAFQQWRVDRMCVLVAGPWLPCGPGPDAWRWAMACAALALLPWLGTCGRSLVAPRVSPNRSPAMSPSHTSPIAPASRLFHADDHMQPSEGEPIRSVVASSVHSVIVAWHVAPGQEIAAHTHPHGQDTWTVLSGTGLYQVDAGGSTMAIVPGDVVVAEQGQVHGVRCVGSQPLRFISVVAPAEAGYEPLSNVG